MRINCPNCEAQYEVEDRLIPEGGRDVQCSNCGHAWFQYPAGTLFDEDAEEDAPPAPAARPAPPQPQPAPQQRPALDESLRAVLREEAAREAAARAAEARGRRPFAPVETQPDLGLDDAPRARPAEPAPPPVRAPRREALPDVEAINSTLAGAGSAAAPPLPPPARSGGFVQGFAAVLLVAMLLYALYAFGPRIGTAVPALAGPLGAYSAAVESAHRALAAALRGG